MTSSVLLHVHVRTQAMWPWPCAIASFPGRSRLQFLIAYCMDLYKLLAIMPSTSTKVRLFCCKKCDERLWFDRRLLQISAHNVSFAKIWSKHLLNRMKKCSKRQFKCMLTAAKKGVCGGNLASFPVLHRRLQYEY